MKISKKSAVYAFVFSVIVALLMSSFINTVSFAQNMQDGLPIPHYFGPYPNYATSPLPTVTYNPDGSIASVFGGIRKFVDSLPLPGPDGANNLGQYLSVAIPDKTTYPGSDYYEIAVVEYMQRMHSDLPPTKLRGYVQLSTSVVPGLHVALKNPDDSPILMPNGDQAYGVDIPRYLGPFIVAEKDVPVRVKFYNLLPTGAGGDLFLPVDTTVMGSGMGPIPMLNPDGTPMLNPDGSIMYYSYTQNRATLHLHGGRSPWISDGTPHQWITPAGEDTVYPKGVSVYNVPDMEPPEDGAMTFYYTNHQSARLMFYHDHSYGITRLNVYAGEAAGYLLRDDVEKQLISQGIIPADEIPLVIQDKTFVPYTTGGFTNVYGTFESQLAFQDPTWDVAKWGGTGSLWYPHVYMPMQNPGDPSGMNQFGRWHYGPWFWPPTKVAHGPIPNPYYTGPGNPMEPYWYPGVPSISMPGEAFMDTPVINGIAYPYLEVAPKAYRFRILNAADDRFFNLQLYVADDTVTTWDGRTNTEVKMVPASVCNPSFPADWPKDGREGGVPDPATRGPAFVQIGNEAGFLPNPVVLPNQPIDWLTDMGFFAAGTLSKWTLLLGTAERADVIVDFSQFAGKTLILYNDAPAPSPAGDPRQDYYTGRPNMTEEGGSPEIIAGYGPNTRTIMQIRVSGEGGAAPADAYDPNMFANLETALPAAFAQAQDTPIVPQAAYSAAYNTQFADVYSNIFDNSLTFTPIGSDTPVTIPFQAKMIQDEMGEAFDPEYGRMAVFLGLELPNTLATMQNMILYGFADPPTEVVKTSISGTQIGTLGDGTQIWKITHNGVDDHTVHWHMFEVQLINRVGWDNAIYPPKANELGWKETIRVSPLMDTIVALRPIVPDVPFDLPNSIRLIDPTKPEGALLKGFTQWEATGIGVPAFDTVAEPIDIYNHKVNFGWEYVWHCHILAHEEMDMMRTIAIAVPPRAPSNLVVTTRARSATLTWTDNSISETGFTIQRAYDAGFTQGLMTINVGPDVTSYTDTTFRRGNTYYYRVFATNTVGDTWDYSDPNINEGVAGFPTITVNSASINAGPPAGTTTLLSVTQGAPRNSPVVVRWSYTPSGDQAGFIVQRARNAAFTQQVRNWNVGADVRSFSDGSTNAGNIYYYRVIAINDLGYGTWSNALSIVPHA